MIDRERSTLYEGFIKAEENLVEIPASVGTTNGGIVGGQGLKGSVGQVKTLNTAAWAFVDNSSDNGSSLVGDSDGLVTVWVVVRDWAHQKRGHGDDWLSCAIWLSSAGSKTIDVVVTG